jgi:hypothetical protein
VAALLSALKEKFRKNVTHERLAKVAALKQPGNIAVPLLADVLKHFKTLLDETGARLKPRSTAADTTIGDNGMVCQPCWLFGASLNEICARTHPFDCLPLPAFCACNVFVVCCAYFATAHQSLGKQWTIASFQ